MLSKIEITNFRGFNEKFIFDLSETKNFEFNKVAVKNGIINKSVIYGINGCGKSNLGYAIFDIVGNLTDKNKKLNYSDDYLNAKSKEHFARFVFQFKFDNDIVEYMYTKKSVEEIILEELKINGCQVVYFDRNKEELPIIKLENAENLNRNVTGIKIAIVKYIANNTVMNPEIANNKVFLKFIDFVNRMLYFRSVDEREYYGFETGAHKILADIIKRKNLNKFEKFLNRAGVKCKLKKYEVNGEEKIGFDFGDKIIDFFAAASTGTKTLALFYYWFQRFDKTSFVFIDEFDAFYHFSLSKIIVEELNKLKCQSILTTHNTSIMSNELLRPDCYFVMDNKSIKPLYRFTEKELREAHNIEKMYRSGAFQ